MTCTFYVTTLYLKPHAKKKPWESPAFWFAIEAD